MYSSFALHFVYLIPKSDIEDEIIVVSSLFLFMFECVCKVGKSCIPRSNRGKFSLRETVDGGF